MKTSIKSTKPINLKLNMIFRRRGRVKICLKAGFFLTIIVSFVLFFRFNFINENSIKISKNIFDSKILPEKIFFNIDYWRQVFLSNRQLLDSNRSSWCDVPEQVKRLANALCQVYWRKNCPRLPCYLIDTDLKTLENVRCRHGGQRMSGDPLSSDILCKRGFALDLFLNREENFTYPSIIADPLLPLSDELYFNVLNSTFRSRSSLWGLYFNFESVSNYPWAGERKYLDLFDITFGYDRSLYDVVPAPWLFNYVDQLKPGKHRSSIEEILQKKTPINSNGVSNYNWIKDVSTNVLKEQKTRSDVKAPVFWMNSNCNTHSKRTEFMIDFMKFIDVDNYGTCGPKIRSLPPFIVELQGSSKKNLKDRGAYKWEDGKLRLASEYLFTIAIENSVNHDYITEKLWHAFIAGTVPIYLGAPNIDEWLPCSSNCLIDLRNFTSAKDAAEFVQRVATNRTLYESFHQWRNQPMPLHFEKMLNYFQTVGNYTMDCILCDLTHRVDRGENLQVIKKKLFADIGRF